MTVVFRLRRNNIFQNLNVIENPTINSISFEGNKTLSDINLNELITSKQRQTLLISNQKKPGFQ